MIGLLKNIYRKLSRIKRYISSDRLQMESVADEPSYFPEKPRKSRKQRLYDLKQWYKRYHEVNVRYNTYGMDLTNCNINEYLDYTESYMVKRDRLNLADKPYSLVGCLENKYTFYKMMVAHRLPTAKVFAFYYKGILYDTEDNVIPMDSICERKDYFVKDAYGICGQGVKHIDNFEELKAFLLSAEKDVAYILQERIIQSDEVNALYGGAVNTLRIVKINKDGHPYVFAKMQRIGTSHCGNVDNWAHGGLAAGIAENGFLKEYAFYKYGHGTKTNTHPDTGVLFSAYAHCISARRTMLAKP